MEFMKKLLSARRLSTLKVRAAANSSARYSRAVAEMASTVFSQGTARTTDTMPNTCRQAARAASMSHASFCGST